MLLQNSTCPNTASALHWVIALLIAPGIRLELVGLC